MLNMNQYVKLTDLFKFGAHIDLISGALNRYVGGQIRGKLTIGMITSSGSGHWPFALLDINFLTGAQSAWQVTVCGITVGSRKVHDLDDAGLIQGPDKSEVYLFISCLNHKDQTLEDIIYAD